MPADLESRRLLAPLFVAVLTLASGNLALAQGQVATQQPFTPQVGQPGKDVIWVPTPDALVEKMLDMAHVGANDVMMDLGSGDGRTVIAAAKRGAKATGIEYDPNMVTLSQQNAAAAGVGDRATFKKADLFETDLSPATVITMFLLPSINLRLRPTILNLKPGTRIVSNSFTMGDWAEDEKATIPDCTTWCTALLWIVPAKAAGTWRLSDGELKLEQQYQVVTGTLTRAGQAQPIGEGRLRGEEISFVVGGTRYSGRINGTAMTGTATAAVAEGANATTGASWSATLVR